MDYGITLNPRQTARTIEQANRHRAEVLVDARIWPGTRALRCRLAPPDPACLATRGLKVIMLAPCRGEGPESSQVGEKARDDLQWSQAEDAGPRHSMKWEDLVGTYCDLTVRLGEQRYLLSCDVVHVERYSQDPDDVRIFLSQPQTLQVAQRRRFRRIRLSQSAQVELSWGGADHAANSSLAWLCNLSVDGLACRLDARMADQILIGDRLRACFSLTPGDTQRFELDAVLCNKIPAGTEGKVILGLQFLTDDAHRTSAEAVNRLRGRLMKSFAEPAGRTEGADT